jgi:hypothetical protein
MNLSFPTIGAAIAIAGADKLAGDRGYTKMFRHLGWTRSDAQAIASAEIIGGLMMTAPPTRRMGGMLVAGVSATLLLSEIRHGDTKLALPRGLVLLAGLAALLAPKRHG